MEYVNLRYYIRKTPKKVSGLNSFLGPVHMPSKLDRRKILYLYISFLIISGKLSKLDEALHLKLSFVRKSFGTPIGFTIPDAAAALVLCTYFQSDMLARHF